MKNWFANRLARLLDSLLCLFTSFVTGIGAKHPSELDFTPQHKVYYANHSSHGDFFSGLDFPAARLAHAGPAGGRCGLLAGQQAARLYCQAGIQGAAD